MSEIIEQETQQLELSFSYTLELWMYGIAFVVGLPSFIFTVQRLARTTRQHLVLAARLFSYKISLTVADSIVLFIYAPTQFAWIQYYWWFGGDVGCRIFKFVSTFGFHLTANMQVLVAADRLLITAKMNQMNRNMKKRQYNTRLSLAAAWILALCCAFPQLILFRQKLTPEGHPQCISIWTEHRVEYYERLDILEQYAYRMDLINTRSAVYFHKNGSLKYEIPEDPGFDLDELNTNNRNWLYLERLYNVLHLATICVLPYALELICYTLILYILKGATKGRFVSLSEVFKDLFCCCFRVRKTGSPAESNNTQDTDNLMLNMSTRSSKRMQNVAPENEIERRRATSADNSKKPKTAANMSVCLEDDGTTATAVTHLSTENIVEGNSPNLLQRILGLCLPHDLLHGSSSDAPNYKDGDMQMPNSTRNQNDPTSARSNRMWVNTVDTARRNARWKAFIMLSLNLVFWAPYCILAITSSVVISQWLTNFQFVNALITFNAVSNIIL